MPLRIAFDLDGVLADIESAYNEIAERLLALEKTADDVSARQQGKAAESPERTEGAAGKGQAETEGTAEKETVSALTGRQHDQVWREVQSTPDFWTTMRPLEPGLLARLHELAARYRWDVFFVTQRPATAGDTVQRQTQRWLVQQGFDLPSVLVVRGSRGKVAAALELDFLIDDTATHCVDVVSESSTRAILVLRHDDAPSLQSATRLGIEVVSSVTECLDLFEKAEEARANPTLLQKIKKVFGH